MTEEELAEYNKKALEAWKSWKDVCWVDGIGKSLVSDDGKLTSPIGTPEEANLLRGEIGRAFRRKVLPFRLQLENFSASSEDGPSRCMATEGGSVLDTLDFAAVFDNCLFECEHSDQPGFERYHKHYFGDPNHVRKAKCWKDVVWAEVAASDDEPLKVIRGRLIGPQGVMNQVVEEWLMAEYSCRQEKDPVTGKVYIVFDTSVDATASDALENKVERTRGQESLAGAARQSEQGSVDDAVAATIVPVGQEVDERTADEEAKLEDACRGRLEKSVDGRQACLLLAFFHGLKIYNDQEILDALGIGKSAAAEALKHVMGDLRGVLLKEKNETVRDEKGRKAIIDWIKLRARAEKAGQLILSRVKTQSASKEGV